MPEGPVILLLKEKLQPFKDHKITKVSGKGKIDEQKLLHKKVTAIKTWGKHLLICFNDFTVRIHLMMFGSYLINEANENEPSLSLTFSNGEVNFYTVQLKLIEENLDKIYDWSTDIMSDEWSAEEAFKKLSNNPKLLVADALLDQQIFAGSGNIIKNEVLFRVKIHPKTRLQNLPAKQIKLMIKEARNYAFDFYKWKKAGELDKHWQAYTKKICPRCNIPLIKEELGKGKRVTYFCNNCQQLYTNENKKYFEI